MANKKKTKKFIAEFDAKIAAPVNAFMKKHGCEMVNLMMFALAGKTLLDHLGEESLTSIFNHDILGQELQIDKPDIDFLHDKRWVKFECSCCCQGRARQGMKFVLEVCGGDHCGGEYYNVHSACKGCQKHFSHDKLYTESALKKFVAENYKRGDS